MTRSSPRRGLRQSSLLVACLVLGAILGAFAPPQAGAVPQSLTDRRARAEAVRSQITELDHQLEVVVERYNQANEALSRTSSAAAETKQRLARAERRLKVRQSALSRRVEGMYRTGDIGFFEVVLGTADYLDFIQRMGMLMRIGAQDARTVAEIKVTKKAIQRRRAELAVQLKERRAIAARVAADKGHIEGRLVERERMYGGIRDEIAALEREEAARRARVERQARSRISTQRKFNPSGDPHTDVVQVAMAQLGKPYRYGASGPDAFDCSGLTMYCYGRVGISLPHHSGSQYGVGEKVGRSELQPGDLVFFGSPIHHVGIYVGSGQYIHAPHTGAVVRIDAMDRGDFAGGARP